MILMKDILLCENLNSHLAYELREMIVIRNKKIMKFNRFTYVLLE